MMTFDEVLSHIRASAFSEREKGDRFERLMQAWLKTDPRYSDLTHVWRWEEFAPLAGLETRQDLGIDLAARTDQGLYWAIQCKFYAEKTEIRVDHVSHFIAYSNIRFRDPLNGQEEAFFSVRYWISTSDRWNDNARKLIRHTDRPFVLLGYETFLSSSVDWEALYRGKAGRRARKELLPHQKEALAKAHSCYADHDRGRLIMACGTGKTFTALSLVEQETGGSGCVLFLVPSIALINQSLNAWMSDAAGPIHAICVCSDPRASRSRSAEDSDENIADLARPATTSEEEIVRNYNFYKDKPGLLVFFSTYQSLPVVRSAWEKILQEDPEAAFDWVICDEAHRTAGLRGGSGKEKAFTLIHDPDCLPVRKRLFMTATPRIYGEKAKAKARDNAGVPGVAEDDVLSSMDDPKLYGEEFFRLGFHCAVHAGLLTDYKVLILTVGDESCLPENLVKKAADPDDPTLNFDFISHLCGCISGLSKKLLDDDGLTWDADPRLMRRALAFCPNVAGKGDPWSSMNTAAQFPGASEEIWKETPEAERKYLVRVQAEHVDGSMSSNERVEKLLWLERESEDPHECRVLCNVRCLSEGIDVPALDAVIFFSPRSSQIEVVQAVGRVMRNFRKGAPDEKKYGYIIIPVIIPRGLTPEEVLADNERFRGVWTVLRALRSHDEEFNALINQIALNESRPDKVRVVRPRPAGGEMEEWRRKAREQTAGLLSLLGDEIQDAVYAGMVEKVGDRLYWEKWARQVGVVARNIMGRITQMTGEKGSLREAFLSFVKDLQANINRTVTPGQTVEMLAQQIITRPVFDVLFKGCGFGICNSVSRSMESMISLLRAAGLEKDTAVLKGFYDSVRINLKNLDNLKARQDVIRNLYEKFFKGAFPKTVEQLGIVYTPVECVDFILHSVDALLKKEFHVSLSDRGVHVLDPFAGTGTFMARLLQSGLIRPEDLERKYREELHCNEIVLLAYYVADVNIESAFHAETKRRDYLRYDGICLTDSFELAERREAPQLCEAFRDNSAAIRRQGECPVRVILGNPPYSVGQKSANDNAQNPDYPALDKRIEETYAALSQATQKKSLYDSYIRAFRWASDRLQKSRNGGIIGFVTNAGWLDSNASAGFRKCLEQEFSSVYVLNLRGDARTSGELRRKEGEGIFGLGSRAPVAVTLLVRKPDHRGPADIRYHDIGEYLSREQKLRILQEAVSVEGLAWEKLEPDEHGEWLTRRSDLFGRFIPLGDKLNRNERRRRECFFEPFYSNGLSTNRDAWCFNASAEKLAENIRRSIVFYNEQCRQAKQGHDVIRDPRRFSWTEHAEKSARKGRIFAFEQGYPVESQYRPFFRQQLYFSRDLNERVGQIPRLFPSPSHENRVICVSGTGGKKDFSVFMTGKIPDLHILDSGAQCFPLWHYEDADARRIARLPGLELPAEHVRRDGVTDWILSVVHSRHRDRSITKKHVFHYVYGILHSPDYRKRFAHDLRRVLPRIPLVEDVSVFLEFAAKGRELAELHLNYEDQPPCPGVIAEGTESGNFRVEKMRFPAKGRKDTILYNSAIRITRIPLRAYDYAVNGRSAIEWVMECWRVRTDRESGIVNDPNDWAAEHGRPRYILDLLLSVITVSLRTLDIVESLPRLSFGEEEKPERPEEAEI